MTMPDPVTAQVIDVPRPRWPELWACLYAHSDATFSLSVWRDREDAEPDSEAVAILRIPASDEPDPTAALRALVSDMLEALMWCGGSADFSPPNGKARGGWENTVIPLMDRARAALAQEAAR